MRTRRFLLIAALAACLMLTGLLGCQSADGKFLLFATPTPSPVPTPAPTPTPVPVIALAGAEEAPGYARAVERFVTDAGLSFEALAPASEGESVIDVLNGFAAEGAASLLLYCPGTLPDLSALDGRYPLFVCSAMRQTMPQGVSNLCYDNEMAPAEALQLAFDTPPHLAPVRMLGLFCAEDSAAADVWNKAVEDGLVMDRGTFYVSSDGEELDDLASAVNAWLTTRTKKLYPGMLDCVFVENGALALHALNALLALNRTDAEIFCAGTDSDICELLIQYPALLKNIVGMDVTEAARISAESAMALLTSSNVIERSLTPQVYPQSAVEP